MSRVTKDDTGIQSVQTALALLELMAQSRGPMGVTEIARRMEVPKPRVYRHLQTLLADGYVERDEETEKYRLGIKLYHLGRAAGEQIDLLAEARRVMLALSDRFGLSVSLGQPIDEGIFILDIVRVDTPFEFSTRPGHVLPYHATAQGKVALAMGPPAAVDRVLEGPLPPLTPHTVTDPATLRRQIEAARAAGWAIGPEEALPGLNALAAPIFDASRKVVATMALIGTMMHLPKKPPAELVEAITDAAHRVSLALGYRDAPRFAATGG